MDPLSITASTAALAHVSHKILSTTRSIRDAPQEIHETSLQIASILATLQKLSRLPEDSFVWHIIKLDLERASQTAVDLHLLLRQISQADGKINYTAWLRQKSKLGQLRTKLKDAVAILGLTLELSAT